MNNELEASSSWFIVELNTTKIETKTACTLFYFFLELEILLYLFSYHQNWMQSDSLLPKFNYSEQLQ